MAPRVPNVFVALLNCCFVVISVGCIGYGLYFLAAGHSRCHKLLASPLLLTGAFFLVVSICGFVASCCHNSFMYLYLIVMFLMLLALLAFTLFVFIITNQTAGKVVSQRGFGEYRLADYSNWLRNHVVDAGHWDHIKSCLVQAQVCNKLQQIDTGSAHHQVSPVQLGCCMPPSACGYTSKNITYWLISETGPKSKDPDCKKWSNKHTILCYECSSCKVGVLKFVRKKWRLFGIIHLSIIVFLLLVYSIGCLAARTNTRKSSKPRYTQYRGP